MTTENWIEIARLVLDFFKTIIPFGTLLAIFCIFQNEIKTLIRNGGLKISAPGLSLETYQKQQDHVDSEEKKEIETLNNELKSTKQVQKKLVELQDSTAKDKDNLFLLFHFERTYRLIFPSQMVILNSMKNFKGEISDALARALFRRTIWALQFNVSYEQFMGFLMQSGLILYDVTGSKFTIAPVGEVFWEYLKKENIPLKIPANDIIETSSNA